MSTASIVLRYLFAARDGVSSTVDLDELIVAPAGAAFVLAHRPLLKTTQGDVLPEEDVECGVDVLQQIVADEHDAVEAVEDHADLRGRVPAVVATLGSEVSRREVELCGFFSDAKRVNRSKGGR